VAIANEVFARNAAPYGQSQFPRDLGLQYPVAKTGELRLAFGTLQNAYAFQKNAAGM